jgi:hypothetical protein
MNTSFQILSNSLLTQNFTTHLNISVDEDILFFKVWVTFKQYIPNINALV